MRDKNMKIIPQSQVCCLKLKLRKPIMDAPGLPFSSGFPPWI